MMLESVGRDQLDREVVEMRDTRRSRLLTCALSAVVAGILVVPATALAVDEIGGIAANGIETAERISDDGQGDPEVLDLKVGTGGDYLSIRAALEDTTGTPVRNVTLVGDITDGPGFTVYEGNTLNIDLNGNDLYLNENAGISVLGTLTIKDSKSVDVPEVNDETGEVNYNSGTIYMNGGLSVLSATGGTASFTFESGTLHSSEGGCVRLSAMAEFTMNGGLIDSADGFAVELNDGASFEMDGGVAKATNYSAIIGDDAGDRGDTDILIDGGYVLSVNEGTTSGRAAVGACQVMEGGVLQVDSGTIRTIGNGVGVIVGYGSFRLNDGEIYGDGTNFSLESASHISVDDGYGLILYAAKAGTEINGGFISGMQNENGGYPVPSVRVINPESEASEQGASPMSLDLPEVEKGVSIKGGTYTNFSGLDSCVASGYDKLGHSANGRSSWITVMRVDQTSTVKDGEDVDGKPINGKTPYVFYGQMDYYRNNLEQETVSYSRANASGELDDYWMSVYVDYPTYGDNQYNSSTREFVFTGWFRSKDAANRSDFSGFSSEEETNNYIENDYMIPRNQKTGWGYAKLSDGQLTHVPFNTSSNLWDGNTDNDSLADMRAFILFDAPSAVEIGLSTQFGTGDSLVEGTKQYRSLAEMYNSITYVDGDGTRKSQSATQINPVANYLSALLIEDISTKTQPNDRYYAYQWWITRDGTHVEGGWWSTSINAYLNAYYPENDLN